MMTYICRSFCFSPSASKVDSGISTAHPWPQKRWSETEEARKSWEKQILFISQHRFGNQQLTYGASLWRLPAQGPNRAQYRWFFSARQRKGCWLFRDRTRDTVKNALNGFEAYFWSAYIIHKCMSFGRTSCFFPSSLSHWISTINIIMSKQNVLFA